MPSRKPGTRRLDSNCQRSSNRRFGSHAQDAARDSGGRLQRIDFPAQSRIECLYKLLGIQGGEVSYLVGKSLKRNGVVLGIFLLLAGWAWRGGLARSMAPSAADPALEQKVVQYIREKFGLNSSVKLTAQPLRPFSYPAFDEMSITMDDGKKTQMVPVFLTKDRHYLIVGALFPLGSDVRSEMVQHVREQFKVPETTKIVAGPLRSSPYSNFWASTVTLDYGKQKQSQEFYVTRDNRMLVLGSIFNLGEDPRRAVLRTISLQDQPSQGPTRAPVTIVEYADLQCPSCATFHGFLEKEVLPKYEGKVRLVFKEFPLVAVHDWSLTAAKIGRAHV